jgi:peptidoglycan hydrolase-like protein with peptidoglycan-binding domain
MGGKGDSLKVEVTRPRNETIAEIQRELSRRGFYDGAIDGVYGPKTDGAIRDFEQVAGLRPSAEPSDGFLQTIVRSQVRAKPAAAPTRNDPIANLLAPDRRITAVQRALSDYGYGQIKASGLYDPETRAAIERFERERKLPVTGQISERLTRELSAMTGRPLE